MNQFNSLSTLLEASLSLHDDFNPALLFAGYNKSDDQVLYSDLKNNLNNIKNEIYDLKKKSKTVALFGLYSKNWNKEFYEILLGVVYANNAYFIIDPLWPNDYKLCLLKHVNPNYLLYDAESKKDAQFLDEFVKNKNYYEAPIHENSAIECRNFKLLVNNECRVNHDDLVYVIATSGTTGAPKMIQVCNSSIIPNIKQISKNDTIYQASSLTFDPSLIEIFCTLSSQATLLILPQIFKLIPDKLCFYLNKYKVNILQLTPTLYKNVVTQIQGTNNIKNLILGGEMFPSKCKYLRNMIEKGFNVFNIYGITELSCWSTINKVKLEDLNDENGVPVGLPLIETKLYIKLLEGENNALDLNEILLNESSYSNLIEGKILHSSASRVCFLDGKKVDLIDSGDVGFVKNKKLYLKGRSDRFVKINAKMLNLSALEKLTNEMDWVENSRATIDDIEALVLFVFVKENLIDKKESLENELKNLILKKLPSHYEPKTIFFVKNDNLPLDEHGKIDFKKIERIYTNSHLTITYEVFNILEGLNINKLLRLLWKDIINVEAQEDANFIECGGNSLKAVLFIEKLETILMKYRSNVKANKMLDYLLNRTFREFENYLNHELNTDVNETVPLPLTKKAKLYENTSQISNQNETIKNVYLCYTKCKKYVNLNKNNINLNNIIKDIRYSWKFDTKKCIDATSLLVAKNNSLLILIGSHSHQFVCLNALNGELKWSFSAKDRIESSACLSKCGNYVIFGSYDFWVYFVRLEDGFLEWKFQTNDIVKSSPCINLGNGYIYFGSHDKKFYCLDFEKKCLVWSKNLDQSSIFAGPVSFMQNVFVTTLCGNLFRIDANTGELYWKFELDKPIFTSPIINENSSCIYLGTCGGTFYCIQINSQLKWTYKTNKPIFSSACLTDNLVIFGCHDSFLYCLNQDNGDLIWKYDCLSEIYATPFDYENKVICITSDGILFIFDLSGNIIIKKELSESKNLYYSSPLAHENKVYFGCRDNNLWCYELV